MSQQLIQILRFENVAPGATIPLPHNINIHGVPQPPDYMVPDQAGVRLFASDTTVECTNNTGALINSVNVWLELKHSIPRQLGKAFGDPFDSLDPRPFIPATSSDRFPFMEANVNADGTTPSGNSVYNVGNIVHAPASGLYTLNLVTPCPAPGGTDNVVVAPGLNSGGTPGLITYEWASPGQLIVRTWIFNDGSWVLSDLAFSVVAFLTFRNF